MMVSNSEIVRFLKSKSHKGGFIDGLKIRYRPFVCPFQDLFGLVKPGDRVGDIGCGSGQFALLLNKFTSPEQIFGIEISQRLIDNANSLFGSEEKKVPYRFEVYDGKTFPSQLKDCNLIFMIDVLHHIPAEVQQTFLDNLYKALSPGTRFILKDINKASPLVVFNKIHDMVFSGEIGNERSMREAIGMAQKPGFKLLSNFTKRTLVYPHYFLVLEKK